MERSEESTRRTARLDHQCCILLSGCYSLWVGVVRILPPYCTDQNPDLIFRSFTPSIVQSLGYTAARSQLMSVPPFATAFALSVVTAYLCDRFPVRGLVCMVTSIITLIGFIIFLTSSSAHTRYGSLFLSIPGVYATTPALASWNSSNSAPHVRRATAIAIACE
jgi:hypothetical protein